MKSKVKKCTSNGQRGITLIALVITIIVLLILAGVAIAALTGENGVLTQAENVGTQTEIAEVIEKAKLDIVAWQTEKESSNEEIRSISSRRAVTSSCIAFIALSS